MSSKAVFTIQPDADAMSGSVAIWPSEESVSWQPLVDQVLGQAKAGRVHWKVDLRPMELISSSGIGRLVLLARALQNHRGSLELQIRHGSPLCHILHKMCLDDVLSIFNDEVVHGDARECADCQMQGCGHRNVLAEFLARG